MRKELIEALDIIWEHSEGRKKIGESYDKKGTLNIVYDSEQLMPAYGMAENLLAAQQFAQDTGNHAPLEHRITIPTDIGIMLQNEQGEQFKPSLVGLIAHEIYHAGDKYINTPENMSFQYNFGYNQAAIGLSNIENSLKIINDFIPENYSQLNEQEKTILIENIYENTNCAELLAQSNKQHLESLLNVFTDNKKIKTYIEKVETPAIDFANEIVEFANTKREYQEPQRIRDYSDSVPLIPTDKMDKETFNIIFNMTAQQIMDNGGKDNYLQNVKEQYEPIFNQLKSGELVEIKDTPQAQVAQIKQIGKMLEQNKQRQI